MKQDALGACIEYLYTEDILKELENRSVLYSLILDKFIEKPRRLKFVFKCS